jgi:hypothetical protein
MADVSLKRKRGAHSDICENCQTIENQIHAFNVSQMQMELAISKTLERMNENNLKTKEYIRKSVSEFEKRYDLVYKKSRNYIMSEPLQVVQQKVEKMMEVVSRIQVYIEMCYEHKKFNDEEYVIETDDEEEHRQRFKNLNKRPITRLRIRPATKRTIIYTTTKEKQFQRLLNLVQSMDVLLTEMATAINNNNSENSAAIQELVQNIHVLHEDVVEQSFVLPSDNYEVQDVIQKTTQIVLSLKYLQTYQHNCMDQKF